MTPLPPGPFRTIVVDPPWRYSTTMPVTGNAPGRTRQRGRSGTNYPTMGLAEIAALGVAAISDPTGCHLYLWTTNAHVEQAWAIARGWDFIPKQLLTWCKKPKGMIGFGAFSPCSEFVLFAVRGRRAIHTARSERTWFEWPRSIQHSAKPDGFYALAESISPAPRIDLFARRARAGWTVWGDEVPEPTARAAQRTTTEERP